MIGLKYCSPATSWFSALPLGNGKTAVMVYGGKRKEKLCFNDATLWSGYPQIHDRKQAFENLQKARQLVFEEKYQEASAFVQNNLYGNYSEAFMPLGDLNIVIRAEKTEGYSRCLDLENAVVTVKDDCIVRRAYVSYPDKVAVYSMSSDKLFGIKIKATSKLKSKSSASGNTVCVYGNAPDYAAPNYLRTKLFPIRYDKKQAMAFCLASKVVSDGKIKTVGNELVVSDAKYIHIYSVTHTGFNGYDKFPQNNADKVKEECLGKLKNEYDYKQIFARHLQDYKNLFDRHSLVLAEPDNDVTAMLGSAKNGKPSAAFINLLYDYGKYLTIAGSRDSQPLNLQGQWNKSMRPPWSSNLTTNINYEMNYWPTSAVNLKECLTPFYDSVKEIVERGKKTAKTNFNANGFCCNHNVDIWRNTSPVQGDARYMFAPLCGAWIVNEMCAHKLNSGEGFDDETKDALYQSALFILDYLVEYKGYLVTCPSASPENGFGGGVKEAVVAYASAFDMGIIRKCFEYVEMCDFDDDFKQKVREATQKLYPYQDTSIGIAEWHKELPSREKGHRHFSPLYAVYPAKSVGYYEDKTLTESAYRLFRHRMDNSHSSIGWSAAWAIALAGRFHDKAIADKVIKGMLAKSIMNNLFDFHPPTYFQIDGNFGFVAGINELLIYEEKGRVEFLPACTDLLKNGKMHGHIINGTEVNFEWKDGKVVSIEASKPLKVINKNISQNAILKNVILEEV